ncbi:hypothetical protein N2152v2_001663 [Parachlorella kessleri]
MCGRFQELSEFDGDKRTCRAKLSHHNQRRRAARSRNTCASEEGGQLADASSLHSELSCWGVHSPAAACRAEHALPPGSQGQPADARRARPQHSPRLRQALQTHREAPRRRQLLSRDAAGRGQQQGREEEEEEDWLSQSKDGHKMRGQPPPQVLLPAPCEPHEARQHQDYEVAGPCELEVHLHTRQQQRQKLWRNHQGQAGQPVLQVDRPQQRPQQVEQQQQQHTEHMDLEQAQREPQCEAGPRLFLHPRAQQHHLRQQPSLPGANHQEKEEQRQSQQQQQDWSVNPIVPYRQEPPEQQWWQQPWAGPPSAELVGQGLHSMHSGQSEGDSLPAHLAERAQHSLGGKRQQQQEQQPQPQVLLAGGPNVGRGTATLASVHRQGPQDMHGAGYSSSTRVSGDAKHGGQPAAGKRQQACVPQAAGIPPHSPLGQADLAAMLSAPKRGPAPVPAAPGQLPPPAARPDPPAAPAPSLGTAHPPAVTPLGARAGLQQKLQPPVAAASGKQASPGGTIDDILELLSWGSHEESEPARVGPGGPWLSPPVLSIPLCSSPLGQARAPTPPFPDPLLPF